MLYMYILTTKNTTVTEGVDSICVLTEQLGHTL